MNTIAPVTAALTDLERDLARHALGLPHRRRVSWRNHWVGDTHHAWEDLVARGLATVRRSVDINGGMHTYRLTRAGAEAALLPGERLDPDHFPT